MRNKEFKLPFDGLYLGIRECEADEFEKEFEGRSLTDTRYRLEYFTPLLDEFEKSNLQICRINQLEYPFSQDARQKITRALKRCLKAHPEYRFELFTRQSVLKNKYNVYLIKRYQRCSEDS